MSEKVGLAVKKPESKGKEFTLAKTNAGFPPSVDINSPVGQILHLQRTIGNRAVSRLIHSGVFQAKLTVGQPGDIFEQEADRVAEQVMRMPDETQSLAQRKSSCPACEEEETLISRKESGSCGGSDVMPCVESHINALKGGGQSLSPSTRSFFEPRFGIDFSHVRVHTGSDAAAIATEINAKAFTTGSDIFFNTGQYSPGTTSGKNLLAHELTHVVQQKSRLSADDLHFTALNENFLQREPITASTVLIAALAVLAATAACALPYYLYAMNNYGRKTDKWRHCWVSCQMSKTCGPILTELAGLGKEIRDRAVAVFCDYYPSSSICLGGHGDFWDSINDLIANQQCIAWESALVGPLARLWRQGCRECCDAAGL